MKDPADDNEDASDLFITSQRSLRSAVDDVQPSLTSARDDVHNTISTATEDVQRNLKGQRMIRHSSAFD